MQRSSSLAALLSVSPLIAQSPPQDSGLRVVAATSASSGASAVFLTLDPFPSVNNQGDIGIVGRLPTQAGEQALVVDGATGVLSAVTFAGSATRDFGGSAVANRSPGQPVLVASRDRVSGAPATWLIRKWSGGVGTILGQSPTSFDSVSTWLDVNEAGIVACSGLNTTIVPNTTTLLSGASGPLVVIKTWSGTQFIRPQIASNGRIVCRAPNGDITAYTHPLPNSDQIVYPIAGNATATGLQPGISDDGQAIGYTATTAAGTGVFIAVSSGSGFVHRQLDGGGGPATSRFPSVVLDGRVGVQRSVDGGIATITVVYLAVDGATTRMCTAQARVETGPGGLVIATRRPRIVASTGDAVGGTSIASLTLADSVLGSRCDVVAGATFADTSTGILRYTPRERPVNGPVAFPKWKQFDPSYASLCVTTGQPSPCPGGSTFARSGCTLTSFATAAAAILHGQGFPITAVSPLAVREAAQRAGNITASGDTVLTSATFTVATPAGAYARVAVQRAGTDTFDTVIAELRAGRPVILAVPSCSNASDNTRANLVGTNTQAGKVHYVVAYGYDEDAGVGEAQGILINDPGYGVSRYEPPATGTLAGSVPGYTSTNLDRDVHVTLHDYFAAMSRTASGLQGEYVGAWGNDPARDNERIRDWFDRGIFYFDDNTPGTVATVTVSSATRSRLIAKTVLTTGTQASLAQLPPSVTVCSPIELRITASSGGPVYATSSAIAQPGDLILDKEPLPWIARPDELTPPLNPAFPPYAVELPIALAARPLNLTLIGTGAGAYQVLYVPRDVRIQAESTNGIATSTSVGQFFVPASPTVCGANPPASLLLGGSTQIGGTTVFSATNPVGTQAAAIGLFAFGTQEDPAQPCGTPLPGFGMTGPGAVGELLVANVVNLSVGGVFSGPGLPAQFPLTIPLSPSLNGVVFFVQAVLVDASVGALVPFGLTNRVRFEIGP